MCAVLSLRSPEYTRIANIALNLLPLLQRVLRSELVELTPHTFSKAVEWARAVMIEGAAFLVTGERGLVVFDRYRHLEMLRLHKTARIAGTLATLLAAAYEGQMLQGATSGRALLWLGRPDAQLLRACWASLRRSARTAQPAHGVR